MGSACLGEYPLFNMTRADFHQAYFGVGVKGVGKAEIPVYVDLISLKGTVNLRALLSATPPFVRTATISLPSLPDFDISAQPLKLGTFNAMKLPGMKSYSEL